MKFWRTIRENLEDRGGLIYVCEKGHETLQDSKALLACIAGTGPDVPEKCPACEFAVEQAPETLPSTEVSLDAVTESKA